MKELKNISLKEDSKGSFNGFRCEVCAYDFGGKRELRCPRCGALQKCGMSCSGNCLKCNAHNKKS